jgi:regulatory protein
VHGTVSLGFEFCAVYACKHLMARTDFEKDRPNSGTRRKPSHANRPVKLPTRRRLGNIAAYYLKRFSSSAQNLRQVLRRRVMKMTVEQPELRPEAFVAIDEIVAGLLASGAINDALYAAGKVRSDSVLKKPQAKTIAKLRAKGVAKAIIQKAIAEESPADADFEAGLAIARRRRLGPYRTAARTRETDQRDLAVLARAGLNFATAKRVMAWSEE